MEIGVVFRGEIERFKLGKIKAIQSESFEIPFEKTLFVDGVRIPADLLLAAWHFLERWDAAVPLWRYGVTAEDVGTPMEREMTRKITRDLRVLLYSYELLFVRRNEAGQALMAAWEKECSFPECDKRLAFLRAFYQVKPRLCVLPRSWLAEIAGGRKLERPVRVRGRFRERSPNESRGLVRIELEPGRMVKVHKGDEERVREHFKRMKKESKRDH